MIEEWIKDIEAKVGAYSSKKGVTGEDSALESQIKRMCNQVHLLYDLQTNSEYLGEIKLPGKSGEREKLFCYFPKKSQGWVLERTGGDGLSSVISYGHITRDDFIAKYFKPAVESSKAKSEENKRKAKKYALLSLPVMIIPAAYYGIKKLLGAKKGKDATADDITADNK